MITFGLSEIGLQPGYLGKEMRLFANNGTTLFVVVYAVVIFHVYVCHCFTLFSFS